MGWKICVVRLIAFTAFQFKGWNLKT